MNFKDFKVEIFFITLSVLFFTIRDITIKMFINLPSIEIVFFISICGIAILIPTILKKCIIQSRLNLKLLFYRGLFGFIGISTFFYSIANYSFLKSIAFFQSSIVFSVLFSIIFLKRKISRLQLFGLLLGIVGIILLVEVDLKFSEVETIGLLCSLSIGFVYIIVIKLQTTHEHYVIVFSFLIFVTFFSFLGLLIGEFYNTVSLDFAIHKYTPPTFLSLSLLIVISALSTLGQTYRTKSYSASINNSIISIEGFLKVVPAIFLNILIWFEPISYFLFSGIILITLSSVILHKKGNIDDRTKGDLSI